ncbi:MAG: glutamate-1-semialdehyde 2,1-aminomutase [Candidatus Magnetoovum sp. WYHC-5]|nr:glutamate-1-semialdehyde 2,1-aminomutase [Candidatus Magnetoovum sp. WYHC-5]
MNRTYEKSKELFERASTLIPGGVNSPVRAFKAVGGNPLFISHGLGAKIYDVDGNEYVDYVLSWGPLICGHAHPAVVNAIKEAAERGTSYGAPTAGEIELAQLITEIYPSIEKVRLVNSGTEATMSAIRVARAFTKRDGVIKFEGCYHGHADGLLSKAGSGATTLGIPTSPGVPASYAEKTITAPFNNMEVIKNIIEKDWKDIACVIVEPVVGNSGCVLPLAGFLEGLRDLTARYGILLIFDEVMTGFRVAYGGAQAAFKISPDMTCLGKVIGGGVPVGAYGGKKDIMSLVAPEGPVYQAGTLSGNPIAVAAGIATLKILGEAGVYESLEEKAAFLEEGLRDATKKAGAKTKFYRAGTMFCQYFNENEVIDYDTALKSDTKTFGKFFRALLERGVYIAPSQFEAGFLSIAHTRPKLEKTIEAAYDALKTL